MFKKILIIDDDVEYSEELSEILRDNGHVVETIIFNRKNLDQFQPLKYDVIILDFKMPDITGVDILNRISLSGPRPMVFFISGRPFLEKLLSPDDLLSKVTEIIPKPFSIAEFLLKIDTLSG
ncbi:MAG: response regulator transcription factor [Candidatus Omnitrophica bacterium]|nr:response regulator transcription factor [Candidatus Omnitrophota bacterium]